MAKTLAQGRKPGSGRKPGKAKTLAEGRKPGSGRKKGSISKTLADGRKAGSGRKKNSKKEDELAQGVPSQAQVPIFPALLPNKSTDAALEAMLLHAANSQQHHPIPGMEAMAYASDQSQGSSQDHTRAPDARLGASEVAAQYTVQSLEGEDRTVQVRYSDLKQLLLNNSSYDTNQRYVQMLEASEQRDLTPK